MSYELVITASEGTERARLSILDPDSVGAVRTPSLTALSIRRQIAREPDETDRAEATVYRDSWTAIESQIDRLTDRFTIEEAGTTIFGGRLRDAKTDSATVSVLLDGFKRDAIDAEPSGGNEIYPPQADSQIIKNELLPRVGTLSAGTINTIDSAAAVSESNASPGKTLTRLAVATGGEVRYNPDRTVDYINRLGSDRNTTLAASAGTLIGDPSVQEDVTEQVTHVRVLGSGSGTRQISAEKVAPSYDTGRKVYRRYVDKDIQQQARAESIADQLIAEYDGSRQYVEVSCEVPAGVTPSLGDSFDISLPDRGISQRLRTLELERIVDAAGERFSLILSNRKLSRDLNAERRQRSVEQFRSGNAGQYYALADGEGWDICNFGNPLEFAVYRPENTIAELRATLHIESRQPRIRIRDTVISQTNDDFSRRTARATDLSFSSLNAGVWNEISTHTGESACSELRTSVALVATADLPPIDLRIRNKDSGYTQLRGIPAALDKGGSRHRDLFIPNNINNDEIAVEINPNNSIAQPDLIGSIIYEEVGQHTHDVALQHGVAEADETFQKFKVEIGQSEVTNGFISPPKPVDISRDITGELSDGSNLVTVSPFLTGDTRGIELRAKVELEGIKNATEPQS